MPVLTAGVPTMLLRMRIPPEMTNSENSRMMNGKYSPSTTCSTSLAASAAPWVAAKGTRNSSAQPAATLPKCQCQKRGESCSSAAIESSIPANGRAQDSVSLEPSRPGPPSAARAGAARQAAAIARTVP